MRERLLLIAGGGFLLVMGIVSAVRVRPDNNAHPVIPCPSDWQLVHAEYGGEVAQPAYLYFTHTRATGDRLWVFAQVNNEVVVHHHWVKYQLRPRATPAEFDFRDRAGIYEFDGRNLRVCFGAPSGLRPTGFWTVKGDERLLLLLKWQGNDLKRG